MTGEGKKNVWIAVLVLAAVIVGGYFLMKGHQPEVKQPELSNWKTTTSGGVTFKYPEKLPTEYISVVDWPPQVQVIEGPFACTNAGEEGAQAGKTETKIIGAGHEYCVTQVAEGAAGSTYNQYAYAYQKGDKTLYFTFTLRETQCGNYDEPQKTACTEERAKFNIDLTLDQIIQSATLPK